MKILDDFRQWLGGVEDYDEPIEAHHLNAFDPPFTSLSQYLNFVGYDENGLFSLMDSDNKPLGAGFVIELNPLLGANDEIIGKISNLFGILPERSSGQIQLFGSPDLSNFFDEYERIQSLRAENDPNRAVFQNLAQKRVDFWKKGTKDLLIPSTTVRLRNMRCIISVNLPDVDFTNQHSVRKAVNILERCKAQLKSLQLYVKTWDANDLVKWVSTLLNPYRMFTAESELEPHWEEDKLLRDQMMETRTVVKVLDTGSGLRFGNKSMGDSVIAQCYSVNRYPEEFHLMGMGGLIGDPLETNLNYTSPFLISMSFSKTNYDESFNKIKLKHARATQVAESPMAKILPESVFKRKRDYSVCMAAFGAGGGGLVKVFHQVVLWDRAENMSLAESQATSIWQNQGFGLYRDQYLQAPAYLSMLPMALDKEMVKYLDNKHRWTTKTMTNAVCMSPIIGEWHGLGSPVIGLFGTRGQAMGIDLFSNPAGNYNFAVIGSSGSGKSFFVNEFIRNYLGLGAQIWIIDVGRSYEKFAQMVGGQYIEFTYEKKLCFPPFQLVTNINDDIELLKLIFVLMASPSDSLTEQQEAKLHRIIEEVWHEHGRLGTVDDVMNKCLDDIITGSNENGQPGERDLSMVAVGDQLYAYSANGLYGQFFNGELNVEFTNDLIVLELEELKTKPDLQQIFMQLIMYLIMRGMYLSRSNYKIMMIDEAWALLGGSETTARFIEEGYRRVRKYKGACGTATQGANDYYKTPASQAALENSDFIFHLRAKPTSIKVIEEKQPFEADPGVIKLLKFLTRTEHYSELYISTPVGSGVGRLLSDPFNALASSSKAEDVEAVNNYRQQGMNTAEAIEAVLEARRQIKE